MIKAIIFDFGQTLVDSANGFRMAEKVAKEKVFEVLQFQGRVKEPSQFLNEYRRIRKSFHDVSDFSRVSIWEAVHHHFGNQPDLADLKQMELDYWNQVKQLTEPFPETIAVLGELSRQYQLGIISNTQGQKITTAHRMALFPEIESFFQVILVAGEDGIPPKPASLPFERCLEQLQVKPAEAIYVGDDYRNDVKGSEAAGLTPIWLKHHLVKRNWPAVETTARIIEDLNELLTLNPENSNE